MAIKTEGFDDLITDLLDLEHKATGKSVERALTAGAEPIFADMKQQALVDPKKRTGNLYNSIKTGKPKERVRRRKGTSGNTATKSITIGVHKKEAGAYAPHAHLVEFGHAGPAPAPPHPFVRPAFDKNAGKAFEIMKRVLLEELTK